MAKNVNPVDETEKVEATTEVVVAETAPEVTETTTTEDVVAETVPEVTEISTTEDIVTETAPEVTETITEEKVDPDFQAEAETLMASQNVKEIWRCPVKGYWFTKAENALDHSKKVDKSPEHYKL